MAKQFRCCATLFHLFLILLAVGGQVITTTPCGDSLFCHNSGQCVEGDTVWPGSEDGLPAELGETNKSGYYCKCPNGYTGLSCEIPYVQCEYPSGFTVCYHGGSCLDAPPTEWNAATPVCNCHTADHKDEVYVGRNCEELAHTADPCTGLEFPCYNGGICTEDEQKGTFCKCADGFEGDLCEKPVLPASECELQCGNRGKCQVAASFEESPWGTIGGKYCDCVPGYAGVECEHKAQICGDNEHACLHGSTCQKKEDGNGFECACNANYQGGYCKEHRRMTYCNPTESYEYAFGMAVPAFCLNGGVCRDELSGSQAFPFCDCPPLFAGPHCEFPLADGARFFDTDPPRDHKGRRAAYDFILLTFVIFILVAVGKQALTAIADQRRQRNSVTNLQSFREENQGAMAASGSMLFPSMAGQQQHGNFTIGELLHDVEIS